MRVNERDVDWDEYEHGEMAFRRKELSNAVAGEELGCSLYELDPGDRSWPLHYHTANGEAMFVLEGSGTVRTEKTAGDGDDDGDGDGDGGGDGDEGGNSDGDLAIESGDFVSFPADERGAHQVVNDGDTPLRYLVVSTMNEPDVTVYPEMGKFGVYVGAPPGGRDERSLEGYYPVDADVGYWEDES